MKPAAFELVRAGSLAEAIGVLIEANGGARPVAGAQSLGPMLNLRLAQPSVLVDITGIAELTRAEEDGDAVTLGACVSTGSIEDGRVPSDGLPMLAAVAAGIAYRAVRNRGTIGGSVCHADPAADWLAALCALGAECAVVGPGGRRRLPVEQFVTGAFEVALEPGELLEAVRIPRPSRGARWGYYKICRKTGEFAKAIGAVLVDPGRELCRAVLGATDGRPIVIGDARALLGGGGAGLDEARAEAVLDERGVTDRARRRHHLTALRRAASQAMAA